MKIFCLCNRWLPIFKGNLVVRNNSFAYNDGIPNERKEGKTMKFSEKIIQARKAKALTQEDLAEAVGVSRQAVSKWETEEAKPDLDKLVAICKVLDLSLDYLCLDKQPEITVELPPAHGKTSGIRLLIVGVCMGLVAALLIGMIAMMLWEKPKETLESVPPTNSIATTVPSTTEPDYSYILGGMKVAVAHQRNLGNTFQISFVPSMDVPGMKVQIAVRNNKIGTTSYFDPIKLGNSYILDYKRPGTAFDLDFIAVCTIGQTTVQFALYNVESSNDIGTSYHWEILWKD